MCPICGHPEATQRPYITEEREVGYYQSGVVLNCPTCGILVDEEIQAAIDFLPVILIRDEEEQLVCPI